MGGKVTIRNRGWRKGTSRNEKKKKNAKRNIQWRKVTANGGWKGILGGETEQQTVAKRIMRWRKETKGRYEKRKSHDNEPKSHETEQSSNEKERKSHDSEPNGHETEQNSNEKERKSHETEQNSHEKEPKRPRIDGKVEVWTGNSQTAGRLFVESRPALARLYTELQ